MIGAEVTVLSAEDNPKSRKEVIHMTYTKPEVRLLANALGAIQGTPKPIVTVMDAAHQSRLTNAAYEADE